jgi:hypothetical protein
MAITVGALRSPNTTAELVIAGLLRVAERAEPVYSLSRCFQASVPSARFSL